MGCDGLKRRHGWRGRRVPEAVDFYLASASPRRRELLQQLGYRFAVRVADIDESPLPGEAPELTVQRLAGAKARAVRALLPPEDARPVLGADTEVEIDGRVLGKPADFAAAEAMLGLLGGRAHRVLSAVALDAPGGLHVALCVSTVRLRALGTAEIRAYWDSGEPRDKAGAYAIQGLAAEFVESIEGSYSGIVGLPLFETAALLRAHAIAGWQRRGDGRP